MKPMGGSWTLFSIRGLLALSAAVAFVLAALRIATPAWAIAAGSVALLAIGTAAWGAIAARGRGRAARLGFAAFGCAYVLLCPGDAGRRSSSHPLTWASDRALALVHPDLKPRNDSRRQGMDPRHPGLTIGCFRDAFHALMTLLIAAVGAAVGHALPTSDGTRTGTAPAGRSAELGRPASSRSSTDG